MSMLRRSPKNEASGFFASILYHFFNKQCHFICCHFWYFQGRSGGKRVAIFQCHISIYWGNWVVFFQVGFSTLLSGDRVATWFKAFQRLLNEDLRETSDRSLGADIFGTWAVNYFHVFFFGTTLIGLMIHHDLCGNSHVLFEKHVCICDIRDDKERCFFFFRENASNLSDVRGGLAGGSKIPMRLTWLLSHRSCSPVGHGEGREAEWPSANLLQVILVWTEGT